MIDLSTEKTIRASAILTDSYVAGTILGAETSNPTMLQKYNQLLLNVRLTIGSLTTAEVKVEFSSDNVTYDQEITETVSGGTITCATATRSFGATGNFQIPIPISARYIKVSAKGTGTVTNSLLAITAVLAVN
jgi:hypothetical protein